ncbi:MAG TPA: 50S ribosomal protein L21 [Marinilabiliales bacterium]|jgi:large subunit ribosomal protein L21|nr:MAG: 50S ribosomal protein L21 [Bacteroidetes bacterium GWA2_40_14]OFX57596.1 MAG: 50S ribosomal protein L21 [Bacteroidetes bacterium GWC2_40_13]OFX73267.1 MAG: 50S ribosomal protein L21 [Bacteroidetes bacterium GWD2_40_43]OFX92122.1 MAG: 50S ribosomal protein L21 [Bacteroidetes bacterium GWE2_40_63]OFY24308.1 MAG: 50S ribosomal protein L21 [Bacteroidetes bacterium GWF2_40_13]OFZ30640.1 MAG: 50S ribosomal protein L21 [Bacteroidetes bacterium RIFOXYC2_FULL_40_12]HAM98966.1 50S ribosomal pro
MYAIVEIGGQQLRVEEKAKVFVNLMDAEEGSTVNFEKVLLIDNEGKVKVGQPVVKGASVSAKVLAHVKGEKAIVFKKKRRKTYQVMNGHRQQYTQIEIEKITA